MALIRCPECGREISDRAQACIHCGFPLSELNKPKPVICPECGRAVEQGKECCGYCGCPMEQKKPEAAQRKKPASGKSTMEEWNEIMAQMRTVARSAGTSQNTSSQRSEAYQRGKQQNKAQNASTRQRSPQYTAQQNSTRSEPAKTSYAPPQPQSTAAGQLTAVSKVENMKKWQLDPGELCVIDATETVVVGESNGKFCWFVGLTNRRLLVSKEGRMKQSFKVVMVGGIINSFLNKGVPEYYILLSDISGARAEGRDLYVTDRYGNTFQYSGLNKKVAARFCSEIQQRRC